MVLNCLEYILQPPFYDVYERGFRRVQPLVSPEIKALGKRKHNLTRSSEADLCPESAQRFIDALVAYKIAKEVCADLERGGYPVAEYHRQPVKIIHNMPLTHDSPSNEPVTFNGQEVVIPLAMQKRIGKDSVMALSDPYAGLLGKKNYNNGQVNVAARLFNDYRLVDHGTFMFHGYRDLSAETVSFAIETFNQVVKAYEWASQAIIGLCAQEFDIAVNPETFHKTRPVK